MQLLNETTQCLILVPHLNLAEQIQKEIDEIGKFLQLKTHWIGQSTYENDYQMLKTNINIVIGTPGRVLHLIKNVIVSFFLDLMSNSRFFQKVSFDISPSNSTLLIKYIFYLVL